MRESTPPPSQPGRTGRDADDVAPAAPNRAARRARRTGGGDPSPGTGKVRPVGTSHAPDPRRFVKARRG